MRLSAWAKENGYSYRGAYDLFRRGQLPNASILPHGLFPEGCLTKTEYIISCNIANGFWYTIYTIY